MWSCQVHWLLQGEILEGNPCRFGVDWVRINHFIYFMLLPWEYNNSWQKWIFITIPMYTPHLHQLWILHLPELKEVWMTSGLIYPCAQQGLMFTSRHWAPITTQLFHSMLNFMVSILLLQLHVTVYRSQLFPINYFLPVYLKWTQTHPHYQIIDTQ